MKKSWLPNEHLLRNAKHTVRWPSSYRSFLNILRQIRGGHRGNYCFNISRACERAKIPLSITLHTSRRTSPGPFGAWVRRPNNGPIAHPIDGVEPPKIWKRLSTLRKDAIKGLCIKVCPSETSGVSRLKKTYVCLSPHWQIQGEEFVQYEAPNRHGAKNSNCSIVTPIISVVLLPSLPFSLGLEKLISHQSLNLKARFPSGFFTHQDCWAVALRQVPGDCDVEVETVLVHARVGVPHLLADEARPRLEAHLHARVGPPVRVQDARPPATKVPMWVMWSNKRFLLFDRNSNIVSPSNSLLWDWTLLPNHSNCRTLQQSTWASECFLWQRSPSTSSPSRLLKRSNEPVCISTRSQIAHSALSVITYIT